MTSCGSIKRKKDNPDRIILGFRPDHPRRYIELNCMCAELHPARSSYVRMLTKSVKGFWNNEGSNIGFSLFMANSLYTGARYSHTSCDILPFISRQAMCNIACSGQRGIIFSTCPSRCPGVCRMPTLARDDLKPAHWTQASTQSLRASTSPAGGRFHSGAKME